MVVEANDACVVVVSVPRASQTAQTYYYAWSAVYPDVRVVTSDDLRPVDGP